MTPSIMTSNGRTHAMTRDPSENTATPVGYQAFDHILWYVGNAKQAASYYVTRMGFKHIAYVTSSQFMYEVADSPQRGLETGDRVFATHVVQNGTVRFVLRSPLHSAHTLTNLSAENS